jgi:benzodiazapine receptor
LVAGQAACGRGVSTPAAWRSAGACDRGCSGEEGYDGGTERAPFRPGWTAAPGRGLDGRCCGLRRSAGPIHVGGPVCAGPRDQTQYEQFERPAFAPPGAVFPVVWSALNLTTATSAWLVWRADEAGPGTPPRRAVLEWWALAVIVRSGYVPLAFGSRRLWAATADSALLCIVMVHYASLARRVDQTAAALAVPRNRVDRVRDRPERGGRRPKQLTGAPPANQVVSAIRTVRELTTGAGRSFRG